MTNREGRYLTVAENGRSDNKAAAAAAASRRLIE